jgi:MmyB-like transcription regulator ligand binding domain
MNLCWDILAWNPLSAAIYGDYAKLPPTDRNLLQLVLARPLEHVNSVESERSARHLISRLRFDYSKHADDPRFEALIRRLEATELTFEHISVVPDGHPGIRTALRFQPARKRGAPSRTPAPNCSKRQ